MDVNASKIWTESNRNKILFSWLTAKGNGELNWWNNETYYHQCTNGKIITMIAIITESMSMHFNINMYKSKKLYHYKCKKWTYHFFVDDHFGNGECDFRVKIVVGMWENGKRK